MDLFEKGDIVKGQLVFTKIFEVEMRLSVLAAIIITFPVLTHASKVKTAQPKWVTEQFNSMSLRDKIGQMIVPWMEGGYKNFAGPEFQRLQTAVTKHKVGGFIIFRGNPNSIITLTNKLQDLSPTPLLFAADYEYGLPTQTSSSGTSFPSNMGLAATGDSKNAYLAGKIIAQESRAIGINWIFAPVADVNNNPDNPVINTRSFGEDPIAVGKFAAAFSKGIHDGGAIATLKHFPGHGDTATDSHMDLPSITVDMQRLEKIELVPFKMGIEAGVKSVMVAHVTVPSVGGESLPATLNPKLNQELLRDKLGFKGLIVTDAMEMGAVVKSFSEEKSVVLSILAGADVILIPLTFEKAIDSIERAIKSGELTEARINQSALRILNEKYLLGLGTKRKPNLNVVNTLVQTPANNKITNEIAAKSITLLRNDDKIFPIEYPSTELAASKTVFILLSADVLGAEIPSKDAITARGRDLDVSELDVASRFKVEIWKRTHDPKIETSIKIIQLDKRSSPEEYQHAFNVSSSAEKIILASFVRRAAGKGTVAIPENQIKFVEELINKTRGSVGVMAFGSPYQIRQFPKVRNYAVTYGVDRAAVSAGARTLFGEVPFVGALPVRIPSLFEIGSGIITTIPSKVACNDKKAACN
jgi:beta-N-acetylhexosaminidase